MNATTNARQLRQHSTDAERKLWSELRDRQLDGHKFRRQVPIGNYIADFVCFEKKVVIEVDGGQHQVRAAYDEQRTKLLETSGFRVMRFWNNEVLGEMEGVLIAISAALSGESSPSP